MAHSHHNPVDGKQSNPVKLAIMISLGTLAVIIGIFLLVQLAVVSYHERPMKDEAAMSDKAVASRLAPVATVALDPNAPAPAPAPAAAPMPAATIPAPAAQKTAAAGDAGKSTYDGACTVCHAAGVAGAPKQGDKAAWAPRIKAGKEALYTSALKGKGAMPPKGGNTALTDDAVKAAVDYMVAAAQ